MIHLAALAVFAATATDAPEKPTVVVANIKVLGSIQGVEILTEELRTQVARHGAYRLAAPEDMAAVDEELMRQLDGGCAEDSCVTELGGAIGAQFVLTGQLGKLGELYNLSLKLVNIETVSAQRAASRRSPKIESFLETMPGLVGELLGPAPSTPSTPSAPQAEAGLSGRIDRAIHGVGSSLRKTVGAKPVHSAAKRVDKSLRQTVQRSNSVDTRWSAMFSLGFPHIGSFKFEYRPWRWLQLEGELGGYSGLGLRVPFSGRVGRGVSYAVVAKSGQVAEALPWGLGRVNQLLLARQGRRLLGALTFGSVIGAGVVQAVDDRGGRSAVGATFELGFEIGFSGSRVKR